MTSPVIPRPAAGWDDASAPIANRRFVVWTGGDLQDRPFAVSRPSAAYVMYYLTDNDVRAWQYADSRASVDEVRAVIAAAIEVVRTYKGYDSGTVQRLFSSIVLRLYEERTGSGS